jgi:hypothetical protein
VTVQSSEMQEPPSPSDRLPRGASGAAGPGRTGPSTSRSRRPSDYRLRGLDLDAPALSEAPDRPTRTRHPSLRRRRRRLLVQASVALAVAALVALLLRATVVEPYSVRSSQGRASWS